MKPCPKNTAPTGTEKEEAEGTHLAGEEGDSGDAQPAMQGVEMCDVRMAVKPKDGDQPQDSEGEGQQVQGRVENFPGQLGPHPRGRQAVHQRGCREKSPELSDITLHSPDVTIHNLSTGRSKCQFIGSCPDWFLVNLIQTSHLRKGNLVEKSPSSNCLQVSL